jgi:flagellar biosynthesis regulator FlaF
MTDLRDLTDLRGTRISVSRKVDVHRARVAAMEETEEMAVTESLDLVTETEDRAEETEEMAVMVRTEVSISHVMADLSLTAITETLVIRTLMREQASAI